VDTLLQVEGQFRVVKGAEVFLLFFCFLPQKNPPLEGDGLFCVEILSFEDYLSLRRSI
jgi:hypothetical protein